jgi:uncharacterized protein (TIGR00369 family)
VSEPKVPLGTPFDVTFDRPQGPLPFVPRVAADGGVTWEYVVDPSHYNPYGRLHGGVVMALMDSAMGQAVAAVVHPAGHFNAAAQMNVNFLAPVKSGVLRASARVVKIGKRLAVVEASTMDDAGTLIAIATATHSILGT